MKNTPPITPKIIAMGPLMDSFKLCAAWLLKYKKPPNQQLLFAERKFCEMQPQESHTTENANAFTKLDRRCPV